jgi:putative transposase
MPRRPRFVCEGEPHHVTQRGNYRQNIFENDEDFRRYSYLVAHYVPIYGIAILAYCLMSNHVHFIVVPKAKDDFSLFFNVVHMRYSQYKNTNRKKVGHLWQGRFYSSVLDDNYLLSAVRYVEQNPVRAKMVQRPWDYIWSSAREHVNLARDPIIHTSSVNKILDMAGKESWREYLIEENEKLNDVIRQKTLKGSVLGSDQFIDNLEQKTGIKLKEGKAGRPFK